MTHPEQKYFCGHMLIARIVYWLTLVFDFVNIVRQKSFDFSKYLCVFFHLPFLSYINHYTLRNHLIQIRNTKAI